MWVAKDEDGYMAAYHHKPIRGQGEWFASEEDTVDVHKENGEVWYGIELTIPLSERDYQNFQSLKWEDEPIEVEIKAIED